MDNPGTYMTTFSKTMDAMNAKYMAYTSAAAHGHRARKVEKLRQEVLDNITDCRYKMTDLPMYKGDNTLRQAGIDYIKLLYIIFNQDYKKIVDVEELAEQSVDEMQIYLLLHEKVSQKLAGGWADLDNVSKSFADKYHVTLTHQETPLGQKLETADKLDKHSNAVYLAFFKCNWEDNQMVKAMNDKKVNDIEQARSALASYAAQDLKSLDTLKPFEGDATLILSCRRALQFYQQEADKDIPKMIDFYLKEEEFEKLKNNFDVKGNNRTKDDVDAYNKALNEFNASVKVFNQTNQKVNAARSLAVNDFNDTEKKFSDEHMPHYR
jgi:hypothetical protein